MKKIDGGLENVPGFSFSAVKCGIRYEGRYDYTLIFCEKECNAAGLFTKNRITAPPVILCRERIGNSIRAILINSTNANACTGEKGYKDAEDLTDDIARRLKLSPESVLASSTGIIGHNLPVEKMKSCHEELCSSLSRTNGRLVPEAIMTTDTFPKSSARSFTSEGREYTIAGTVKGSGMIAPDMATLLAFVITDYPLSGENLNRIFKKTVDPTLNSINIDGDMSTNDTAIILSPVPPDTIEETDTGPFEEALYSLLKQLSEMLVMDAEGATRMVTIKVINAASPSDARLAAKAVSESMLVKTAIFGRDPNWGRIIAAAGYSCAEVDERKLSIYFDDFILFEKGSPCDFDYNDLADILNKRKYSITIDLGLGEGSSEIMTSDLSYEYVRINAEYST